MRTINKAGLAIIKHFEGLRLKAYFCPAGVLTIGWGHTGSDVKEGMVITTDIADRLLLQDLNKFCILVETLVKVPLTDNQFSALVAFSYNVGVKNFTNSTLLRKINLRTKTGILEEFLRWTKSSGKVLPGLVRRRVAERDLFIA